MNPLNYISNLDAKYQAKGFPPYKWLKFSASPFTPLRKPLSQSRLALISSAGIFREDQEPFDPWAINDLSFRLIPVETAYKKLRLAHNYFDHRNALKDLNCVFPVERLKELADQGLIEDLTPHAITLGMGRLFKRTALQTETVPKIINVLQEQKADIVLLVPA
ncbi:MAG: glycine/sarcosine/betaine reductase selenoprotein B family protein [Desulfitobacteriaceae bacterium]|nr:glycine/sarcosine/betaine reductase selenoprotein B family protein [Desulfitobacteriaceae bacterium]MDI6915358.1 glycine/sarcosine/betaine reductase selenoprotein B family protein [Desulfitobacteriaceae bacterium]